MKELQDLTVSEWIELKNRMSNSMFKQLVATAKAGQIKLPAILVQNYSPNVNFDLDTDVRFFQRVKDTEALNAFNAGVKAWAEKVEKQLKVAAESRFEHPDREVSMKFPRLSRSIRAKVRFDKTYRLETRSVGFQIARHGVYKHHGAAKGYGGLVGSKWTDKYGRLKSVAPESMGKQGTDNHEPVHWFNDVIRKNIDDLIRIVADYSLDVTINLNKLLLP